MTATTIAETPAGPVPGYLAVPSGPGPWPAVVVIHELLGLNDDIRAITDRFAAEGYLAFAPDLFATGNRIACLVRLVKSMGTGQGLPAEQLLGTREWLAARTDCTGKVGVAGFCLGGGFAIVLANKGFAVSAAQYGGTPKNLAAAMAGSCPMVASYGARDKTLTGVADKLSEALAVAGVPHDVKEYPEAGHSFMNHTDPPWWTRPLVHKMQVGYVDTAATDAWQRILAMFESSLTD